MQPAMAWANPFLTEAAAGRASVHMRVMRDPLSDAALEALGPWLTPQRMRAGTVRNWNTVRRLVALMQADGR